MPQTAIEQILRALTTSDANQAWNQFLEDYANQIYQVIHHFEPEADRASDCFQFVCEQLVQNGFRRLRKFKGNGPATFSTWLRSVVRNLCIDWHRKEFGRRRTFRSISRLSPFDQEVFRLIYEREMSTEESLSVLGLGFSNASRERLSRSQERIETELTDSQRWAIAVRSASLNKTSGANRDEHEADFPGNQIVDPRPGPEAQTLINESRKRLRRILATLTAQERMMVLLRFEENLTLQQIGTLLNLGNAQRVDRKLKEILSRIREQLS
jgi:RNA polymerase sigma factor (sigma-70 family)